MDEADISDEADDSNDDSIEEDSEEDDDDEGDGSENHEKIVSMFYAEDDKNLPKYKHFMQLREEINLLLK